MGLDYPAGREVAQPLRPVLALRADDERPPPGEDVYLPPPALGLEPESPAHSEAVLLEGVGCHLLELQPAEGLAHSLEVGSRPDGSHRQSQPLV